MSKLYAIVDANGLITNVTMWDGTAYAETLIPAVTEEVPAVLGDDGKEISPAREQIVTPERTEITGWKIPDDHTAVQIDDAHIGGTYINGVYTPPHQEAPPSPTPAQEAAAAIAGGIVLASTATAELNGPYNVHAQAQATINAVTTYVLLNNKFPANGAALPWVDKNGEMHTFSDVPTFKAFATAVADFVAKVSLYGDSNGQIGAIPSNAILIP